MAKSAPGSVNLQQVLGEALNLHRQGRLDEAERLYSRVLKADRNCFDALHLLGVLQRQRGKTGEAYRLITAALKIDPRSTDALSNLGLVLHALKRDVEAVASLEKALAIDPRHLDALNNRGSVLIDLRRASEAITSFDALLALQPRHIQALVNRGNAHAELGECERALADYEKALALAPGHPHALYNRGNALRTLGRELEAVAAYDQTLAAMPRQVSAWHNRGLALAAQNRHEDALQSFGQALAIEPNHADSHFNAAASLLTLGDWRRGFAEYEWRWKRSGMGARRSFSKPLWLGEFPLAGRTILLHAEQGLGDTVQFARYAPVLAASGAKVLIESPPELTELLRSLDGVAAVATRGEALSPFDLQCPLVSLPLACRTEVATIPASASYLHPPESLIERWRPRLEVLGPLRVAIAWSGRPSHPNDRRRSMALTDLAPLLEVPDVRFVSVQRDVRASDAAMLAAEPRVVHLGDDLADFSETAAVLSLCDLVICVDTSVAHVAGALGRPTWLMVPFQPDWRWLLGREDSPWYPTMRLFRQSAIGDWTGVSARLCNELAVWSSRGR
jgi:tetratricopeptide (TPR) repeat protein